MTSTDIGIGARGGAGADDLGFHVRTGLPAGWDELVGGAAGSFRERWVRLAENRLPEPFLTFSMGGAGGTRFAMIGGIMPAPTGHVRFDPYRVLSGGSADDGVIPDGPHPWRDVAGTDVFPSLLIMFPGYETAPVGPAARDRATATRFLEALRGWARAQQVKSISFLFLREDNPEFLETLREAGFALTHMLNRGDLEVTWNDFEGYVAGLPRKRRFTARREIRSIADRGIDVRTRSLALDEPDLIELRCMLVEKYGGVVDRAREAETIRLLHQLFDRGDLLVVEATKDQRLLAFALFVRDGDVWTSLMTGADYTDADSSFTYFAVMFYRPAALAPRLGISRIVYGLGSLDAKRYRGCTMTGLWAAGARCGS
jgi:uncharacterized protein